MQGVASGVRTGGSQLSIRPLLPNEAPFVVRYFLDASAADLDRMGVDPTRLPGERAWRRNLAAALALPDREATSAYTAWLVDGQPIGYAALKSIRWGESADIHLHMWSAKHRGRGFGPILFCLSVLDAFDRFRLKTLVCEPKASNPMPNGLLRKVGFPLVRTYQGSSSELSLTTTLNRYSIDRRTAEAFLRKGTA